MDPQFFTYSHVAFAQKKGKKKQKGEGFGPPNWCDRNDVFTTPFPPHDSSNHFHAFPLLLMQ